jgi:hypothetical protein
MVINLISGVKMPNPENLRNNLAIPNGSNSTPTGATVACQRLDDKIRWCCEHIAPIGNRAEMLRISKEPVAGLLVGQSYYCVDDFDLDGSIDIGTTTTLEGEPYAPVGRISQFSIARRIAATNFAATFRPFMTKASRLHSSTWVNSDTRGRRAKPEVPPLFW